MKRVDFNFFYEIFSRTTGGPSHSNSHYIVILATFFLFSLLLTPLGTFSDWVSANDHTGYYSIVQIDPGDDSRIHSYLRSMVIDGDIDFYNEKGLWNRFDVTSTGYSLGFMYAIGSSILWLPFFLTGHLIAHIYSWFGYPVSTDGYSFPYLVMTGIGSATYLFLGLLICYDLLRKFFSRWVALVTVNVVWLGTYLPFYAFIRSRMAHANEFFMVCLTLYAWFHIRKKPDVPILFFIFGIISGLLGLIRLDDLPILSFFAVDFLIILFKKYKLGDFNTVKNMLKGAIAFTIIFSIILSIPLICADIIWGNPLAIAGPGKKDQKTGAENVTPFRLIYKKVSQFKAKNITAFYFAKDKGLFLSSPFWLFALAGLYFFWKKERYWATILLIGLSYPLIFNTMSASTGLEYGNRKTTSCLPFLAFGFAAFFDYARINQHRWKNHLVFFIGIILILWQYLQLIQHKIILPFNHPTFITSAFSNLSIIFTKAPELLLRSSSWMQLVLLKDFQLQNYNDIFFLIAIPVLQLIVAVTALLIYHLIANALSSVDRNSNYPLIKTVSAIAGLFFLILPVIVWIANPEMADAEISKRVEFVEEIKNSGVNKDHSMITLEDYEIYYRIASSYVDSKHMDKAIPYINKAIFINPGYYEAKFLLATVYHRKEKIDAAVKGYEELIKINKEHSATFKAYKNLGIIYLNNLKDMRKVTEYFRKSLEIAPHQGEAENMKALIKNLSAKMGKEAK